jgi:hypothetical protein
MNAVNTVLRGLFDALLLPFRGLPPWVGLVVVSLLTAVGMLLIFKKTSNQAAVERVKRQIHAGLFEIRLFNDDFRAIVRAQLSILRHNLRYLQLSLVPMLFMLPPLMLVIAQLQFHYGYAPLGAGDHALVEVVLAEGWDEGGAVPASAKGKPRVELEVPAGVAVETPAVWQPAERTLTWRLRVDEPGNHALRVVAGGQSFDKMLTDDGRRVVRRSPLRPGRSFVDKLLYPAEPALPGDAAVDSIAVTLADNEIAIPGGWTLGTLAGVPAWMTIFFVLSLVFAFALRKPFGVQI